MGTSDFLKTIFDFLNTETEYAVLRNFEGLPHHNNSRDIDIAIEKNELQRIRPQLISLIEQCGWHIVTYLNSDRLVTWVCGTVHENNSADLVQLDFFYHTSIFGIVLIENKEIIKHRLFNGQVYHANKVYEFLDKYMYDRAVGATYPEMGKVLRKLMPKTFILVPGYGAQGGKGADLVHFFNKDGLGAIVNSSRGIIAAYKQEKYKEFGAENYADASRQAVKDMILDISTALENR